MGLLLFAYKADHLVAAPGGFIDPEGKHLRLYLPGCVLRVCHGVEDENGGANGCGDMGGDGIDADEQAAVADQGDGLLQSKSAGEGINAFAGPAAEIIHSFAFGRATGNEQG
jgi:hypothetical protein